MNARDNAIYINLKCDLRSELIRSFDHRFYPQSNYRIGLYDE